MADFAGFAPLKANFTQTPNQFFGQVVGHYDPCIVSVVALLIHFTQGENEPGTDGGWPEADLPLSAFLRPSLSERTVQRGIAGAIAARFIVETQSAGPQQPARYALASNGNGKPKASAGGDPVRAAMLGMLAQPYPAEMEAGVMTVTSVKIPKPIWERLEYARTITKQDRQDIIAEALRLYFDRIVQGEEEQR